jgi:hypothetical protein
MTGVPLGAADRLVRRETSMVLLEHPPLSISVTARRTSSGRKNARCVSVRISETPINTEFQNRPLRARARLSYSENI